MDMKMCKKIIAWVAVIPLATVVLTGCDGPDSLNPNTAEIQASVIPGRTLGKSLFDAKCAVCHGQGGVGTMQGPPLVHKYYEPGHHADSTFHRAVNSGVRQHHWQFGDMPPIAGVSPTEVNHIIAYVRQEQRRHGIQ